MKKNAKEKNLKKVCGKMLKWAFRGGWEYGRDGLKLSDPKAKTRVICLKRELTLELKEAGILPL